MLHTGTAHMGLLPKLSFVGASAETPPSWCSVLGRPTIQQNQSLLPCRASSGPPSAHSASSWSAPQTAAGRGTGGSRVSDRRSRIRHESLPPSCSCRWHRAYISGTEALSLVAVRPLTPSAPTQALAPCLQAAPRRPSSSWPAAGAPPSLPRPRQAAAAPRRPSSSSLTWRLGKEARSPGTTVRLRERLSAHQNVACAPLHYAH